MIASLMARLVGRSEPASFDIDTIAKLLKNERRRRTIDLLAHHGTISAGDLGTQVAMLEHDIDQARNLSSKQRKSPYTSLYQCHLPKLDDANVVDMRDGKSGLVRQGEAFEAAQDVLECLRDRCGGDV